MRLIAVKSLQGGAGATSIAANLAAALHAEGQHVLAIDLCPSNLLRLFFAMPWQDKHGLAPQIAEGKPWHEAAYRNAAGIQFIPYGRTALPLHEQKVLDFFNANGGLRQQLQRLDLAPDCWVIVDCPSGDGPVSQNLFAMADRTLTVLNADPAAYAHLHDAEIGGSLLLNRFDPRMQLDRDIGDLLRHQYRQQMAPLTIHRDESLREALACRQTVFEYAPDCLVLDDLVTLATWLRAHVSEGVAA